MARFVEESKMSKRARRELNAARRKTWDVNPVSKKVESKKLYNRKKSLCGRYDDGAGAFLLSAQQDAKIPGRLLCRGFCCLAQS